MVEIIVVILIGLPGSGKEEFVKIAANRGFSIIRMGDIVREEARRRGLELNDKSVGELAHSERERFGYGIWASRTVPRVTEKYTVIDGCRGDAEINIFKQTFSTMYIIGIFASPETRYRRLRARQRQDSPLTIEDFYERDRREIRWGIGNAFIMADYMIVNEGSLEDYRREINRILDMLMSEK